MSLKNRVLQHTLVYRLWMAPFAEARLAPVLANNDLTEVRRILDVGCGPGINTSHFLLKEYLGIDFNRAYIDYAVQRYGPRFVVADVTTLRLGSEGRFDFVLMNSLLHHLDDREVHRLLKHVGTLLADDGHVHIVELVLPRSAWLPRFLAQIDRGKYPRSLERWEMLLGEVFDLKLCQPFSLTKFGLQLWNLVYFKGRLKK